MIVITELKLLEYDFAHNQPLNTDSVFQCGIVLIFEFGYKTKLLIKVVSSKKYF